MSIIRSLRNALSGRTRHWNAHNNKPWSRLWARTEELQAPSKGVMKGFLLGSWLFVDGLVGPTCKVPTGIDCLTLNGEQFGRLHQAFLEYSAGVFARLHPGMSHAILQLFQDFTGINPERTPIVQAAIGAADSPEEAVRSALHALKNEAAAALGRDHSDPILDYCVMALASASATAAFSAAKQALATT